MDSSFEEDLGADSVDLVELVMAMEEEFELDEIPEEELTCAQDRGRLRALPDARSSVMKIKSRPALRRGVLLIRRRKAMQALEEKLGYRFRSGALLEEALRHSSYANEHRGAERAATSGWSFWATACSASSRRSICLRKHPDSPGGGADAHPRGARVRGEPARGRAEPGAGQIPQARQRRGEPAAAAPVRPSSPTRPRRSSPRSISTAGMPRGQQRSSTACCSTAEREEVAEEQPPRL